MMLPRRDVLDPTRTPVVVRIDGGIAEVLERRLARSEEQRSHPIHVEDVEEELE